MEKLGSEVLEHSAKVVKDKFVEIEVKQVLPHPRFALVSVHALLKATGVPPEAAADQIVSAAYKAAIDVSGYKTHKDDQMSIVFSNPDFHKNKYLSMGMQQVSDAADNIVRVFEEMYNKYKGDGSEEVPTLEGVTEITADIYFADSTKPKKKSRVGVTRPKTEGWVIWNNLQDMETNSTDIIPIPMVLRVPPGMDREWVTNLCVPLALLMTAIRVLEPGTHAVKEVRLVKTFRAGSKERASWMTTGPSDLMIQQAGMLRAGTTLVHLGEGCVLPDDLHEYATLLGCYIHVVDRACGNQVVYLGVPDMTRCKTSIINEHRYLYKIGNHVHAVQRPEKLLANFKPGLSKDVGSYLCDFCYYTIKDKRAYNKHVLKCGQSGVALTRPPEDVCKAIYQRFHRPDFRDPWKQEPHNGYWCDTCKKMILFQVINASSEPIMIQVGNHKRPRIEYSEDGRSVISVMDEGEEEVVYGPATQATSFDPEGLDVREQTWDLTMRSQIQTSTENRCMAMGHKVDACALTICTRCSGLHPVTRKEEHLCYCPLPKPLDPVGPATYWFFDFETIPIQRSKITCSSHHVVYVYLENYNGEIQKDYSSLELFGQALFNDPIYKHATFISHNGGKFDMQLLFGYILDNAGTPEFLPFHGSPSKLLQLKFMRRRFIDSYSFISLPLSGFAKAFGLKEEKGHFPHMLGKQIGESLGMDPTHDQILHACHAYTKALPIPSCYDYEHMKGSTPRETKKKMKEFDDWWTAESVLYSLGTWNFYDQMKTYCKQDVKVLREGCLKYREMFLATQYDVHELETPMLPIPWTRVPLDPFQYLTQSQACQALFMMGLPNDMRIAHFPLKPKRGWSKKAILWLEEKQRQLGFPIQHIGNSTKEKRVMRFYTLDGYGMDPETGEEVFLLFHGCYWHGCPQCFPDREMIHPHKGITMQKIWDQTMDIQHKLSRMLKKQMYVTWEHEFDDDYQKGLYSHLPTELTQLIQPDDYFFGGRVEVFWPYYQISMEERIRYIDVTSLYPTICCRDPLPIGHPKILRGDEIDMNKLYHEKYFGVVHCEVICPTECFIPLLPVRNKEGRLIFDLVSPKQGSWTTVDLYFALSHGYMLVRVFEVHHFEPDAIKTGLFLGYVDYFLRVKCEADGWPHDDMTILEKKEYIQEVYRENGNIGLMRVDCVEKNPGRRLYAKLILNSLWGKFVQQPVLEGFQFITTPQQFRETMMNPTIEKGSLQFMYTNEETLLASYLHGEEFAKNARRYNPYLGAFVTAHGRRRLHETMMDIGTHSILYCDTDSIVYVHRLCDKPIETKPGLGNWSNVLDDDNYGTEFIASGPKSYCLRFHHYDSQGNDFILKSKGLTLNHANSEVLNPDSMQQTMMEYWRSGGLDSDHPLLLDQFTIRSKLMNGQVFLQNVEMKKKFDISLTKRKVVFRCELPEGVESKTGDEPYRVISLPYGYESECYDVNAEDYVYLQEANAFSSVSNVEVSASQAELLMDLRGSPGIDFFASQNRISQTPESQLDFVALPELVGLIDPPHGPSSPQVIPEAIRPEKHPLDEYPGHVHLPLRLPSRPQSSSSSGWTRLGAPFDGSRMLLDEEEGV